MSPSRGQRGVVYTPPWVAQALVRLGLRARLEELEGERLASLRILDPACGEGALLVAALQELRSWWEREGLPGDPASCLHGLDTDAEAVARAQARLGPGAHLEVGDALAEDSLRPGYDVILANPPYVRRRALPAQATGLARRFASARTGHLDLYLPFVERSLGLLRASGILALIAPSAWLAARNGAGLRQVVGAGRHLHTWVDFGDHQVFDQVITYTALQVYRPRPSTAVRFARAPGGEADLTRPDWSVVPWESLPADGPWVLLPEAEQALWHALRAHPTLDRMCDRIAVGVQTSADAIYHLRRLGPGRYQSRDGREVALEDGIMRPLVSGADVHPWTEPRPETWLLLPYQGASLIPADTLARRYPGAWAWLRSHEARLRARERGRMDRDDRWWGYNYPKNLTRQHLPKLLVPRLTRRLGAALDAQGRFWLDNVDVSGVLASDPVRLAYLLGVLNSSVAHWVWVRGAKPFQHGYRSANKQFIASVPVPEATRGQEEEVGRLALAVTAGEEEALGRLVERVYELYGLSARERALVESG